MLVWDVPFFGVPFRAENKFPGIISFGVLIVIKFHLLGKNFGLLSKF